MILRLSIERGFTSYIHIVHSYITDIIMNVHVSLNGHNYNRAKYRMPIPTYGQLFGDQIHSICIQGQQLWTKGHTGFQNIIQPVYKYARTYMMIKLI